VETLSNREPLYHSWTDFLAKTASQERLAWCESKAAKANRRRLMSGKAAIRVTRQDVWSILERAEGRCYYCGSLAVEHQPAGSWQGVGRRVGTLGHLVARALGGDNNLENLVWACAWCNTWPHERRWAATDHGGHYPEGVDVVAANRPSYILSPSQHEAAERQPIQRRVRKFLAENPEVAAKAFVYNRLTGEKHPLVSRMLEEPEAD